MKKPSPTPSLEVAQYGRVLEITLNRPDKRNALSHDMCAGLVTLCEAADSRDSSVGAICLKANGPVFCAGMDLDDANTGATEIHARLFSLGDTLRKPLICAIAGPALGGGLGLVANAHIAVAAHGATFGLTEIRVGMWPFVIYPSIERAFGPRRALELALSSKIFNTPEAFAWGLVSEVVPPIELDERVETIAQTLANASSETLARGLAFVAAQRGLDRASALSLALSTRAEQFLSPDFAEGVRAFQEKRAPRWPSNESIGE
jgi:enoyl-CoA hydratase/carnithine racemase